MRGLIAPLRAEICNRPGKKWVGRLGDQRFPLIALSRMDSSQNRSLESIKKGEMA